MFVLLSFKQTIEKSLRDPALELQRRAAEVKDDDPIIPFGSLPTVSRFGAISRTSKSGYQPAGLLPGPPAKHAANAGTLEQLCSLYRHPE